MGGRSTDREWRVRLPTEGVHVLYFRDDGVRRQVEDSLGGSGGSVIRSVASSTVAVIRTPFPFHANLSRSPVSGHRRSACRSPDASAGQRNAAIARDVPGMDPSHVRSRVWRGTSWCRTTPRCGRSRLNGWPRIGWVDSSLPVDLQRSLAGAMPRPGTAGCGLNAGFFYPEVGISTLGRDDAPRGCTVRSAYGTAATRIVRASRSRSTWMTEASSRSTP